MHTNVDRLVTAYEGGRLSRRQLITHLAGMCALAAAPTAWGADEVAPVKGTFAGTDLNHIALRVTDIRRSVAFYQEHLQLEIASVGSSNAFLRCGERDFLALFRNKKPGLDHYCFSVEGYEAGDAVTRLKGVGLEPRRRENRVYFDDPDGIEVQVAAKTHGV